MKRYYLLILVTTIGLLVSSCGKDWLDVNTDPNNPASASPENVFPAAVMSTASVIGGHYNILGGIWSQYFTQSNAANQFKYIETYTLANTDFQSQFNELYSGALNDFKYVRETAEAQQNWNYVFASTVMECFTYQILVDLYDKIPYREALGGVNNLMPKYDDAALVYDSLIAKLKRIKTFNLAAPTSKPLGTYDFLFNGDMTKWTKFANTLMLKIYLRQMYVRPTVTQNGIAELVSEGAQFLDVDAKVGVYVDQPNKDNPTYASVIRGLNVATNLRASATLHKFLAANSDTRAQYLYGTGVPLPQGGFDIPSTTLNPSTVAVSKFNANDPVFFISLPESYFLQAEAVVHGFMPGNAKSLYDNGVLASFSRWGLNGSSYIASGGAYEFPDSGTNEQKQEAIMMQKWVAMANSQGIESFLEINRTHYPKPSTLNSQNWTGNTFNPSDPLYTAWSGGEMLYSLAGATANKAFPKRLLFPATERQRNNNCPEEKPVTAKVWWDVK